MNNPKFYHLRFEHEDNPLLLSNLGGATLLVNHSLYLDKHTNKEKTKVTLTLAVCSTNDNFSRKLGRLKCLYRFHNKAPKWYHTIILDTEQFKKLKYQDYVEIAAEVWPQYLYHWNFKDETTGCLC